MLTSAAQPVFADAPAIDAPGDSGDGWVLALSLDQPALLLPGSVRCAELGLLRGFFHGLLFDRQEMVTALNCDEVSSDAELVLRAYQRGGEAALSQLRGSFVVAIVDGTQNKAIVARDPLGSHPLFYSEVGSRVLFASLPHPLLRQPGVSRALNRAALADS